MLPRWCALLVAAGLIAGACDGDGVAPQPSVLTPSGDAQNVGIVIVEEEITLRAHLFGPLNDTAVILSHMRPNDQSAWYGFAEELAGEGFAVLTFDFRGYGETGGETDFDKLDDDLAAAVRFVRNERGKERVFLVGASMGGTTSLVLAARESVDGVVAISAPAEFEGQDALGAAPNVSEPKLFIASEEDTVAIGFQELLDAAGAPKESELYPGNAHGTALLDPPNGAAFRQRILQFLRDNSEQ